MPQSLHVIGVHKEFKVGPSRVQALSDVNLELEAGRFGAIIGPSGCGKSTLLRMIADLVTPDGGELRLGDSTPSALRRQKKIGFVFQTPSLLPWNTVRENIELPLRLGQEPQSSERNLSLEQALKLVGLEGFANARPHQLSGGMQQRVAIARALMLRPDVLLMDEPFGALDELTRQHMNIELARILREIGTTVVLVTHNISEAVFMADRVWVMSPRPGTIQQTLDIKLPTRRQVELMDTPLFNSLLGQLRRSLFSTHEPARIRIA
jgi:NitT/TauT family transport system ATP-binding protein